MKDICQHCNAEIWWDSTFRCWAHEAGHLGGEEYCQPPGPKAEPLPKVPTDFISIQEWSTGDPVCEDNPIAYYIQLGEEIHRATWHGHSWTTFDGNMYLHDTPVRWKRV